MWRGINTDEVAEPNNFATIAAVAAFTEGEEWLDELRTYLAENKKFVREFIGTNIPKMKVVPSEATYLLWLDCSDLTDDAEVLVDFIRKNTGLFLTEGIEYGEPGKKFIRMNVACPRARVEDGLLRLKTAVEKYESSKC